MSSLSFNRKRVKLKQLLGIRARLALLAVILVAPLMLERARSLENARAKQIALASEDFAGLARHSADTLREVISSVETMLKSAAYIRASAGGISRSCDLLRASLPSSLPWIRNELLLGGDGRVQCSTNNSFVGVDLNDKPYVQTARVTRDIVFSDFVFIKDVGTPVILAAYPVAAINKDSDALVIASISLDWMSRLMNNLGNRPGMSAALIDSNGVVLAAPPDQADTVGRSLDDLPLLSAVTETALHSGQEQGSLSFSAADASQRKIDFTRIAGTG